MIAAGRRSKTCETASWIFSTGDLLGAEGLDEQADRLGLADRVRDLDLAARGEAGGHDVLGDPAHGVGGGAVDLGRVLAGEGAAAVAGHAAVGVDDDLAAGQAGVAHRAADLEAAGRVDQQPVALGVQLDAVVSQRSSTGSTTCSRMSGVSRSSRSMSGGVLGGDDHGVEADGLVAVVLDGDLGLAVGPQVGDGAVLADLGQPARPAGAPA